MKKVKHHTEEQPPATEPLANKWTIPVMVFVLFLLIFFGIATTAGAQKVIGIVDFYGLKTVRESDARKALLLTEGDTLRTPTDSLQKRLLQLPGVYAANVVTVCCVEGRSVLFVGLQEEPVKPYPWKKLTGSKTKLPVIITRKYAAFGKATEAAVRKGDDGDDFSAGHSLFRNPALKKIQTDFIPLANKYFTQLSAVLQHSAMEKEREAAATVIAYADNKQAVADQYVEAMTDPSPAVRNNVFRALAGLSVYAASHKNIRLRLKTDLLVWLLNSPYWTDRDKALFSLMSITENRDSALLRDLKKGALPSLLEMAKWKSKGHAVLAFVLLGRMAGLAEDEIFAAWTQGRTETLFKKLAD